MGRRTLSTVGPLMLRGALALVTGVVVLWIAQSAAHAAQPPVAITTCGQTVSADAVLTRNLVCAGDGITITADGVTVDLAGYSLRSSTGTGGGIVLASPLGSSATVQGPGRVAGFGVGVEGIPSDPSLAAAVAQTSSFDNYDLVVDGVTLADNGWGVQVLGSTADIRNTTIRGTNGIGGLGCNGPCAPAGAIELTDSFVRATGRAVDLGLGGTFHSSGSQLRGGTVLLTANARFAAEDSSLLGVGISCSESFVDIDRSRLVDTSVGLSICDGATFRDNTIRSTHGGVAISLDNIQFGAFIERNRFSGWTSAVLVGPFVDGLLIGQNKFEDNGTGVVSTCPSSCGASARLVSATTTEGNALRGNLFARNSVAGVTLGFGTWAIGDNKAVYNTGLGIDASSPQLTVIDEGGNVAFGNAEPQCVGVVCAPRH